MPVTATVTPLVPTRRRRSHPPSCGHCQMVREYRAARDAAIRAREVACGDEDTFVPTFKWWLINVVKGSGLKAEYAYVASAA